MSRTMTRLSVAVLFTLFPLVASAHHVPNPIIDFDMIVPGDSFQQSFDSLPNVIIDQLLDVQFSDPNGNEGQWVLRGTASGGTPPAFRSSAAVDSAAVRTEVGDPLGGGGTGVGLVTVRYGVGVHQIAPPPGGFSGPIPMTALFRIAASVTGPGPTVGHLSGFALGGTLDFLGGGFDEVFTVSADLTTPLPPSIVDTISYSIFPSDYQAIILRARCFTGVPLEVDSNECTTIADPIFSFDQDAFDAQQGGNSFPLADFYEIVLSPGIANGEAPPPPVPSLSAWALVVLALLILALSQLRARASRPSAG